MISLRKIVDCGLPVNWTIILVGWQGFGSYYRLISSEEVIAYATDQLETANNEQFDIISKLAYADSSDTETIAYYLRQLASDHTIAIAHAQRIWRVVMLKELLATLDNDPVYDLIKLTEFWGSFNYPIDSPHSIQGVNNTIQPQEYYTQANLQATREEHQKFLEREMLMLSQRET